MNLGDESIARKERRSPYRVARQHPGAEQTFLALTFALGVVCERWPTLTDAAATKEPQFLGFHGLRHTVARAMFGYVAAHTAAAVAVAAHAPDAAVVAADVGVRPSVRTVCTLAESGPNYLGWMLTSQTAVTWVILDT